MAITNATRLADFGSGIGTEGAVIQIDNTNKRVGIGTTNPQAMLQVGTAVTVYGNSGIVSATTFRGDVIGDVTGNASGTAGGLTGTPDIAVRNITGVAATFTGEVTYEDVTNVDSTGIVTAGRGLRSTTGGLVVTAGVSTFTAAIDANSTSDFNGVVTVSNTTQSSSKDSGAIIVEGGAGIEKNLFVGGGAEVTGVTTVTGTLDANGALDVDGHTELDDVNIAGVSTFSNDVDINGITVGRGGGDIASNISIGVGAGSGTATGAGNNIAIGQNALASRTSGLDNIGIGYHCLYDVTGGNYNVAMGRRTGQDITGSYNVALGMGALYYGVGINSCVAVGYEAGARFAGPYNVAIGHQSGLWVTGSNNTIIGAWAQNESFSDTILLAAGQTERMRITNNAGFLLSNGILVEHCKIVATAWSTTNDISLDDGNVFLNTANLAGTNNTIDITSSNGLNVDLAAGDMTSVTLITAVNSASSYINSITIAAATPTINWVGGSAPSDGGSSGYDVYTFNIIKTGANAYVVIGNQVKGS